MRGAIETLREWRNYCRDPKNCENCEIIKATGKCFAGPVAHDKEINAIVNVMACVEMARKLRAKP